ncbi:MAG: hypothetical protein ACTHN5_09415 [Phycisphaerae bacterium]
MNDNALNPSDTRRCPACEYDLRGNTSGRCPECGTIILSAASSRLPWLYQKARGGITAYLQTVALLLFKPRQLAAETHQRIQRQPARRFHQESIALATFLGAGLFAVLFLLRPAKWEPVLAPTPEALFENSRTLFSWSFVSLGFERFGIPIPLPAGIYRFPLLVWTDRLFILIPALPALYFSLRIIAWCYRAFFRFTASRQKFESRRAARLAYYGSGLAPVLISCIGVGILLRSFQSEEWTWAVGRWFIIIYSLWILLIVATPILFFYPTLTLLSLAAKYPRRAIAAMILLFPPICFSIIYLVTLAFFWTLGYIVIALWSMTH